ncbi:MAG: hypothetical protein KC933_12275 [Myxococcales bacterium]|nr:hypothetical protein [Myxococcales bacterium]
MTVSSTSLDSCSGRAWFDRELRLSSTHGTFAAWARRVGAPHPELGMAAQPLLAACLGLSVARVDEVMRDGGAFRVVGEDGGAALVSVAPAPNGGAVVTVTEHGPGMAQDDLHRSQVMQMQSMIHEAWLLRRYFTDLITLYQVLVVNVEFLRQAELPAEDQDICEDLQTALRVVGDIYRIIRPMWRLADPSCRTPLAPALRAAAELLAPSGQPSTGVEFSLAEDLGATTLFEGTIITLILSLVVEARPPSARPPTVFVEAVRVQAPAGAAGPHVRIAVRDGGEVATIPRGPLLGDSAPNGPRVAGPGFAFARLAAEAASGYALIRDAEPGNQVEIWLPELASLPLG